LTFIAYSAQEIRLSPEVLDELLVFLEAGVVQHGVSFEVDDGVALEERAHLLDFLYDQIRLVGY
jgi:hypothetical protein